MCSFCRVQKLLLLPRRGGEGGRLPKALSVADTCLGGVTL